MSEINVIYWSQSGNTEKMAEAVVDGINEAGATGKLVYVSDASVNDIANAKVVALGCPAMGAEVLEEAEMEPFMADIEGALMGKSVALFGSYGWGDGQWMRDWEDRVKSAGATLINGEGLICHEEPDDDAIAECKSIGKALAAC